MDQDARKEENAGEQVSKGVNQDQGRHQPNTDGKTQEETLAYVTPYALNLNPALIGKALAKPWKRFFAITIDGAFLGLFSLFPALIFIPLLVLWRYRRKKITKAAQEGTVKMRFPLALVLRACLGLVFILVFIGLGFWFFLSKENSLQNLEGDIVVQGVDIPKAEIKEEPWMLRFVLGAIEANLAVEGCETLECWKLNLIDLAAVLPDFVDDTKGKHVISAYVETTQLKVDEKAELENYLISNYGKVEESKMLVEQREEGASEGQQQSVISWLKGLLSDLGLGFGWAAVYFSVFTAAFSGRTPGKYLMGLRVVKIDNSAMSLWEAFGRYGGYGAGLATGLLGFLQVYWDPNRQAIQDKIAATMVLDAKKSDWHPPGN